jgi:hypothetical protein
MIFNAHHLPARVQTDAVDRARTDSVVAFIEPMRGTASFVLYRSAASHFLYWLNLRGIPITNVDMALVRRFAKHRCCCPYYTAKQLRDPIYISRVGRFVHFLEARVIFRLLKMSRTSLDTYPFMPSAFCRWDTAAPCEVFIVQLLNISQPGFVSCAFNGAMSTTPSLSAFSDTIATARSGAKGPSFPIAGRRHADAGHIGCRLHEGGRRCPVGQHHGCVG